jgi:hypothetical protein
MNFLIPKRFLDYFTKSSLQAISAGTQPAQETAKTLGMVRLSEHHHHFSLDIFTSPPFEPNHNLTVSERKWNQARFKKIRPCDVHEAISTQRSPHLEVSRIGHERR